MKSYIAAAEAVYEGIISDASARWPTLQTSLERDLSRLRRDIKQRGLGFLTLTLPAFGKVFDRALDEGSLSSANIPQGIKLWKKRPLLFGDLFNLVFDDCNMLRLDACVDAVAYIRQLLYCCKRMRLPCDASALKETLDEFYRIEEHLPSSWPNTWDSDEPIWSRRTGHPLWGDQIHDDQQFPLDLGTDVRHTGLDWSGFRRLCLYVTNQFGPVEWWDFRPKHGPGVVSEAKTSYISKYEFPNWPRKLGMWFPFDWFGSGQLDSDYWPNEYEPPSRLIAVPKSQKGPRLICAEPIAHQWMQQSIWRWLEERLRSTVLRSTITFRSQENSRNRALNASRDGSLATIDLSSASDRLSTRLVEYIFQGSQILEGLHAVRTRCLSQNLSEGHPKLIVLKKFSTMGSAVTFPVQSIVFALIAVWALRLVDGKGSTLTGLEKSCREVTVFGDDIILPTRAVETVKLLLTECGLKVNESKSFSRGLFRESCGCDAFKGYDVTPAYALEPYDDSPSSMATVVETANNFFRKGYWRTAANIVMWIPAAEYKNLAVSSTEDGTFGLFSFVGSDRRHLKRRYDPNLQREYSIALQVASKAPKVQGRGFSSLTQYFTERPAPDMFWESGQVRGVSLRKRLARVYD